VNKSCIIGGSDGSAARGGASDLSEWQRSVGDDGVRAEERTGHRNRTREITITHAVGASCPPGHPADKYEFSFLWADQAGGRGYLFSLPKSPHL